MSIFKRLLGIEVDEVAQLNEQLNAAIKCRDRLEKDFNKTRHILDEAALQNANSLCWRIQQQIDALISKNN